MEMITLQNFLSRPEVMLMAGLFVGVLITRMVLLSRVRYYRKELKDVAEELHSQSRASLGTGSRKPGSNLVKVDDGA
jgi:uncharacterized membrane-anchored protein YhcB (DUF1043 family)